MIVRITFVGVQVADLAVGSGAARNAHGLSRQVPEIAGAELEWVLAKLSIANAPITEEQIANVLALPSGSATSIIFDVSGQRLAVERLDAADAPATLHFVREPQPRPGEKSSSGAQD